MKIRILALRLITAIAVGVLVFVLSCLAVWRASPASLMTNTTIDLWTLDSLRAVDRHIQERIKLDGELPRSLEEISPTMKGETFPYNPKVEMLKHGVPVDGWGRPILYSVDATTYTLLSYGRDGMPGGEGFDRDVTVSSESLNWSSPSLWENPPMPTLHQFLFELPTRGMLLSCVLSGIIAFFLSFFLVRPVRLSGRHMMISAIKIGVTVLVTIFFATIIMQLHIPTGH